jgi:cytochrome c biogenesis protein CcdA
MEMSNEIMQIWLPLIVAALVQASFGLGVSMLTLLSGHLLSDKKTAKQLPRLSFFYCFGSFAATYGLLVLISYLIEFIAVLVSDHTNVWLNNSSLWAVISGVTVGIGLAVMLFYYRWGKKNGTQLWLPRRAAEFLHDRTRVTKNSFETFILGMASVVAELPFIIAPMVVVAYLALLMSSMLWVGLGFILYTLVAVLPLVILSVGNRHGHKISVFQKWREKNKKFLQIMAGALLIILGFYLFTYKVLGG